MPEPAADIANRQDALFEHLFCMLHTLLKNKNFAVITEVVRAYVALAASL